jgi:hypothetical protein
MVLDSNLIHLDSVVLYPSSPLRIKKDEKADLEAITAVTWKNRTHLLVLGSGSLAPNRSVAWLIDPETKEKTEFPLDAFYSIVKDGGLSELNVEGICAIPGGIIISNRGHRKFPKNHLVFTTADFWHRQKMAAIRIVKVGASEDSMSFEGVSGLAYAQRSDKLLLTVSTENTNSTYADGEIGKSYLWIIDNISSKKRLAAINPNRVIDLEKTDHRFVGHKIESVCVIKETRNFIKLALVADNDNGASTLFRLDISKK